MTSNDKSQEAELLPCPFCGSNNIGRWHVQAYSNDSSYYVFGCNDCLANFHEDEGGAKDWNRRTAPAEPASDVAPTADQRLPELPEPVVMGRDCDSTMRYFDITGYTADQMRDFAHAAIDQASAMTAAQPKGQP